MGNLKITQRRSGDIVVLDLDGQIRLGQSNLDLHKTLRNLVHSGESAIILNLADVTSIDSSGLGELVAGYASLEKAGGELKLVKLTERVSELMMITKLLTVFNVYDSESEAIESFPTTPESTTQPLDNRAVWNDISAVSQ